jgi:2-methylisocitrate lyase-like PEP mutase family enzyme
MSVATLSKAARLRELLDTDELIVAPGVYDGITAALVSKLGFTAAYMTGAGVSASGYGLPDIGLVTLTEMANRAAMLAKMLEVPLIADADTGYGSPINIIRTVVEYERAGVAAIQLEDQLLPKRCGHLAGKKCIPKDQFALALQAALDARRNPDTVIIARTDAIAPLGLTEAIERANLYASIGADVIFIEAPESIEAIERIASEVAAPKLLNVVPGGLTPTIGRERLAELGFRIAIHPGVALQAVVRSTADALTSISPHGRTLKSTGSPEDFFDLFGLQEWYALGSRYDH